MLDPGEKCDPMSSTKLCPMTCENKDPCIRSTLTGSAAQCSAECTQTRITMLTPGDKCCPNGATSATDSDCPASCGNGKLDAGEMCDPQCTSSPCPTSCNEKKECMKGTLTGSAGMCNATCMYSPVTEVADGDGCCPGNATILTDDDCKPKCGDGVLTAGESCDGHCPTSCDDADSCTIDEMSGDPEHCNVRCTSLELPASNVSFNGCCPKDGDATTDLDCEGVCGNGVVELLEQCDPGASDQELTCDSRCFWIEQSN